MCLCGLAELSTNDWPALANKLRPNGIIRFCRLPGHKHCPCPVLRSMAKARHRRTPAWRRQRRDAGGGAEREPGRPGSCAHRSGTPDGAMDARSCSDFPRRPRALFVTGTSMANLIAILVARDAALGFDALRSGGARPTHLGTQRGSSPPPARHSLACPVSRFNSRTTAECVAQPGCGWGLCGALGG